MNTQFYKYQGAGNDFIVIDNRELLIDKNDTKTIKKLCDRRFGIGADGLMLLQSKQGYDFEMVYFNSDGKEGTMCGNGGRCIVAFAYFLGIIKAKTKFWAIDGEHLADVLQDDYINLKMGDVTGVENNGEYYFLNTGSPHYVQFVTGIEELDVFNVGRSIRYNERFKEEGTNVNFVEEINSRLMVRTYERGVENETLACGTGITACAIAASLHSGKEKEEYDVKAVGGDLKVRYKIDGDSFKDIWLEGSAVRVFSGEIII
ncbi:MAG TPA: diaminopimelate epimerase [Bacteroidales bacterium]|jgi:diaminopimelate epimerase|nr:diaminopimelate epimerase [Bacteroidales bacterium]